MYLDIVLIDYLAPNGVLTTYRLIPNDARDRVVIDRLADIDMTFQSADAINIGGVRVYNSSTCSIRAQQAKIRHFTAYDSDNSLTFGFSHIDIPVGSQRSGHGGFYNLILPPGFKLTDAHVVDPYDRTQTELLKKKHFRHDIIWDTSCNTSLVSMFLTSSRGTFSFILFGKAKIFDASRMSEYLVSKETDYAVTDILNHPIITSNDRKTIADSIADKSDWLELKPNIAGIGINLNQIIEDSIHAFQKRIKNRK